MKNYIYNRIVMAEQTINDELNSCLKYRKAKDIIYTDIRERVMKRLTENCKTMPDKYKEQISAILWFCFKREISSKFLFPVLFEGKLYSKWDSMPEACKDIQRSASSAIVLENRPYPVFVWHFTEGMKAE